MNILEGKYLTFDDVLLLPQYSEIESRSEIDISTRLGTIDLKVPIISANMDTITGAKMAIAMHKAGGLGILHRYAKPETIRTAILGIKIAGGTPVPSIGTKDIELAESYFQLGCNSVCIDIAHGDSRQMVRMISECVRIGYANIIAGNVATDTAAYRLLDAGANIIKVGIGPGSICKTRSVTGHGVPQLTAISEVYDAACGFHDSYIIADGGLRDSGDIVKALAAGADAVMTGSLFAGCLEAENPNIYRGMASKEAQMAFKGSVSNDAEEGTSFENVKSKGPVEDVMKELAGGIRSGLSYTGSRNIKEFVSDAVFIRVSGSTIMENSTRHPNK